MSTSGSTGRPKLVRLSHQNLYSNVQSISEYLDFNSGERTITTLPAYYSYGLSILHSHLLFGHTVILNTLPLSDKSFSNFVRSQRVTSIAGVPHSYELLFRTGFFDHEYPKLLYLTQAGGKLSPDRVKQVSQWATENNKKFYVMYGQTEAAPRMAYLSPEDAYENAKCIGIPIPEGSFRIDKDHPEGGSTDGSGELIYIGPNVMMGYAYSADDFALGQGPNELKTGDIAVKDSSNYYRIIGRMSRFSKLYGLRLSFDDIEQRLNELSADWVAPPYCLPMRQSRQDSPFILSLVAASNPLKDDLKPCTVAFSS